ncbi:MAG TPA: hypothetical protein VGK99_21010 [Acidobacteriota bacterium]|jgi:hypothetical protein
MATEELMLEDLDSRNPYTGPEEKVIFKDFRDFVAGAEDRVLKIRIGSAAASAIHASVVPILI